MVRASHHFIAGEPVPASADDPSFDTINPGTGEVLASVPQAGATTVDRAVESARDALTGWSARTGAERGRILWRAAQLLRDRVEPLTELEVRDSGKPLTEALAVDVISAADCLEYFAGLAPTLHGEHIQLGRDFVYTRREPIGVCVGLGAWNYPMQIASWKSAPALACGNTMVFKPAELTPLSAVALAEIYAEAGLPPGVFDVVHGDGGTGSLLTHHPGVDKVSLTGEVTTGKTVMTAAAGTLKAVTLELGGKSPLLVFADADLDAAVQGAIDGNFANQGEVCSNGTRVFVERSRYEDFCAAIVARAESMTIGDPIDPATEIGALISADHLDKVSGFVDRLADTGARVLTGGRRPDHTPRGGFYYEPTVVVDTDDGDEVVREEIFGPVMAVLPFDNETEAIARANNTRFGLAAGVFTANLDRAHRVAAALEAGICWVNCYNLAPIEMPYGGVKESGLGRENGRAAVEHYTQTKSVYVAGGRAG